VADQRRFTRFEMHRDKRTGYGAPTGTAREVAVIPVIRRFADWGHFAISRTAGASFESKPVTDWRNRNKTRPARRDTSLSPAKAFWRNLSEAEVQLCAADLPRL